MLNKLDRADDRAKRAGTKRSIQLPGKTAVFAATNPHDIARDLRAKSKLGEKERKLADN